MNAFHTAALAAANAHNVLSAVDRAAFAVSTDASELDGWAALVVYDLSSRCKSFTPTFLTDLIALGREAGTL